MEENKAIELLKNVMRIPSVNGQDDEGKAAEYLCDYFRKEGIDASVDRIDSCHANVTAILEGEASGGMVIWNGHLDTVPYGSMEDWHTDPSVPVQKGTRLFGRGASDMKSGLCAMVSALCRYKRSGRRPAYTKGCSGKRTDRELPTDFNRRAHGIEDGHGTERMCLAGAESPWQNQPWSLSGAGLQRSGIRLADDQAD